MKKILLSTLAFALAVLVTGAAEPEMHLSSKKVREEVKAVVEGQLAALRAGDFTTAYGFAATGIKDRFEEDVFALMIRRGYPLLIQSKTASLGMVRDQDGEVAQVTVTVFDRQKHPVVYLYLLAREEAGWRITGVTLEQGTTHGDV